MRGGTYNQKMRHWFRFRGTGRRSGFLGLFGIAWIAYGFSIPGTAVRTVAHPLPLDVIPISGQVTYYVIAGAIAVLALLARRRTWEVAGFAAISIPPALRAVSYAFGWVQYLVMGNGYGAANGWASALVYLVILGAIMIVASWPDGTTPILSARSGTGETLVVVTD